jgi:hypothetical protein
LLKIDNSPEISKNGPTNLRKKSSVYWLEVIVEAAMFPLEKIILEHEECPEAELSLFTWIEKENVL